MHCRTTPARGWRRLAAVLAVWAFGAGAGAVLATGNPQADALARLKAGNARFASEAAGGGVPVGAARRAALLQGQTPFAAVLSCADSRVPPEIVFQAGLGDLLVVRAAGHVTDRAVLASLEYGAEHLRVPLLVVMGHEMCDAVKTAGATSPGASLGPNLDYLIKAIRPATARAANQPADVRLRIAILENVEETINTLVESSRVLRHLIETDRLMLVGAYYELSSGRVIFSQPVSVPPSRAAAVPPSPAAGQTPKPAAAQPARPASPPPASPSSPAAGRPAAGH